MAVTDTVAQRAAGDRPGRLRAFVAAAAIGGAAAYLTYRVLRSDG